MAAAIFNTTLTAGPVSSVAKGLLHTGTSGAVLLVWVKTNEAVSMSAVNAGANAMTRITAVSAGTSRMELWGLTSVPTGILTISAHVVGGANSQLAAMVAQTITGHQPVAPWGTAAIGTAGSAANVNLSVSATATSRVFFGFGISANASLTITNPTATTRGTATHSTTGRIVVGDIAGAAAVSISATAGATTQWAMIGVHIKDKPPPIAEIGVSNFSTDDITSGLYTKFSSTAGGVATITVSSSAVVIVPDGTPTPIGFPTPAWGVNSTQVGVFSGSQAYARIDPPSVTATDNGSLRTLFGIINADPIGFDQPNDEGIGFELEHLTTSTRKIMCLVWGDVADTFQNTANATTITYVAANHAWFQLRNDGTNVFWEAAPNVDGAPGTYSVLAQMTVASISTFSDVQLWLHRARIRLWTTVVSDAYSNTFLVSPMRVLAVNTADSALAVVTGSMSATEGFADTFVASAKAIVRGRLSATDVGDTFLANGDIIIRGRLSATEANADTFVASAKSIVRGRLSATEANADTFLATGKVRVSGRLSATDVGDSFVALGTGVSVSAPAAPVALTQDDGAGGGAGHDFWDVREEYLRSLQPEIALEEPAEIFPEPDGTVEPPAEQPRSRKVTFPRLNDLVLERRKIVTALHEAPDIYQLYQHGRRLRLINRKLRAAKAELAAIQAQLVIATAPPKPPPRELTPRERKIARLRKTLATLELARSVLQLSR